MPLFELLRLLRVALLHLLFLPLVVASCGGFLMFFFLLLLEPLMILCLLGGEFLLLLLVFLVGCGAARVGRRELVRL